MDREIKYQVYWKEDKIITSVDTLEFLAGGTHITDGCCHQGWLHKDCELMQFTGLYERTREISKGKEIYFDNIVRCYGGEYCQGYWEYDIKFTVKDYRSCFEILESEYVQIIGDIYNNPDLKLQ